MELFAVVAQLVVAASVFFVWVVRRKNIAAEFEHFGFSTRFKDLIGTLKLSLSALLVLGIWFAPVAMLVAPIMAVLMLAAVVVHFRVRDAAIKSLPAFCLMLLSIAVTWVRSGQL